MLEGKGVIEDTDMPVKMQIKAMDWASQALDVYDVLDYTSIAAHIKKVFLLIVLHLLSCSPQYSHELVSRIELSKKYISLGMVTEYKGVLSAID